MRIDGKALNWTQTKEINQILDKSFFLATTANKEEFIQGSCGPDAIELLVGGRIIVVEDRQELDSILYRGGEIIHIACKELFSICAKFSPVTRLTWHLQKRVGED